MVQNSRITLSLPISRAVFSPWYFLSWESSPIELNEKMRLLAPINGGTLDHDMRGNMRVFPNLDPSADLAPGTDVDTGCDLGFRVHNGARVDQDSSSRSAPMILASATTASSTRATAATCQTLPAIFFRTTSTMS